MPDGIPDPTNSMPPAPPGWVRLSTTTGSALIRAATVTGASPDYEAVTRVHCGGTAVFALENQDEVVALVIAAEEARRTAGPSFTFRAPATVDAIAALREVDQYWRTVWESPEHGAVAPHMRAAWRRVRAVLEAAGIAP